MKRIGKVLGVGEELMATMYSSGDSHTNGAAFLLCDVVPKSFEAWVPITDG